MKNKLPLIGILAIVLILVVTFKLNHSQKKITQKTPAPKDHMMNEIEIKDDRDFILNMIPHHQEAIDVSTTVVKRVSDPTIRKTAEDIITVQTKEVDMLRRWLKDWYGEDYAANSNYKTMMRDNYDTLAIEDINIEYFGEMIGHHEGAIAMAKQIVPITKRTEVKEFAIDVISTQSEEIYAMRKYLDSHVPVADLEKHTMP